MKLLLNQHKPTRLEPTSETGFVLPLVISVGLIMLVGSAAMLARSFGGLIGSTRLEQSRQAKRLPRRVLHAQSKA